jgi:hypothetical protein
MIVLCSSASIALGAANGVGNQHDASPSLPFITCTSIKSDNVSVLPQLTQLQPSHVRVYLNWNYVQPTITSIENITVFCLPSVDGAACYLYKLVRELANSCSRQLCQCMNIIRWQVYVKTHHGSNRSSLVSDRAGTLSTLKYSFYSLPTSLRSSRSVRALFGAFHRTHHRHRIRSPTNHATPTNTLPAIPMAAMILMLDCNAHWSC